MNLSFASCVSLGERVTLPSLLKMHAFPSDKVLCSVAGLDCYKERSIWREKNQTCQIFVSFIKPHNAV